MSARLFRHPTGLYIPDTWDAARRSGPRQLLDWYARHCGHKGPVLGRTTGTSGTIAITSQADANALRGYYTKGNLYVTASNITIRNIWNEMDPATYVGPTCYLDTSCANLVFENCKFDGVLDIGSIGIGGDVSYNTNITFRYCEVTRCGFDSVRMFKNSRLEYCLIHNMREWVPGTDGTYVPDGDQSIYPHCDGIQIIRPGNTIYRCAVINNLSDQATSCIMCKPDAGENITDVVVDECYFEGANNYSVHFVTGPSTLTGVILRNCLFSKNFGGFGAHPSTPVSFGSLSGSDYTFTGNRWADSNLQISGLL